MNQSALGAIRALGYPILFFAISYVAANLGASGLVDTSTAAVMTALLGIGEHYLAQALGYNLPATA